MDCQHIQKNELHERYLLGRLEEAERSEYEKHIERCGSCRDELAKHKTLISGIQAVGREEMKQQIREQVGELKKRPGSDGSKWQMILKIAAVLFIVAMIPSAIYYFRTDSGQPIARLLKPEPVPAQKQSFEAEEGASDESLSKKGEEQAQLSPIIGAIDTEAIDSDQHYADAISEQAERTITSAPKIPSTETASGGSGRGYAVLKNETKQKKSITMVEASEEKPAQQAQSIPMTQEKLKDELLSKLSQGTHYQYDKSENAKGESLRFEAKETTAREYNALTTQELARDYRAAKQPGVGKEIPVISTAVFKSGEKLITVNFVPPSREITLNKESNLPQSFDVDILERDSVDWKMNWYVNRDFTQYDPSQMQIVIEGQTLYLIIPQNNVYKIAANADTTKAILVEK
jgi:hypothetical protein